jgi:hypothetical protein
MLIGTGRYPCEGPQTDDERIRPFLASLSRAALYDLSLWLLSHCSGPLAEEAVRLYRRAAGGDIAQKDAWRRLARAADYMPDRESRAVRALAKAQIDFHRDVAPLASVCSGLSIAIVVLQMVRQAGARLGWPDGWPLARE